MARSPTRRGGGKPSRLLALHAAGHDRITLGASSMPHHDLTPSQPGRLAANAVRHPAQAAACRRRARGVGPHHRRMACANRSRRSDVLPGPGSMMPRESYNAHVRHFGRGAGGGGASPVPRRWPRSAFVEIFVGLAESNSEGARAEHSPARKKARQSRQAARVSTAGGAACPPDARPAPVRRRRPRTIKIAY